MMKQVEPTHSPSLRVVIVAENVSKRMGGEALLPLQYFKLMRDRQIEAWIVCHARVREELAEELSSDDFQRIRFVEETWLHTKIWQISQPFPYRVRDLVFSQVLHLLTQQKARLLVQQMLDELAIQLVFQPSPIPPKAVSFMYDLDVPVVIGPMCGGLELPSAFQYMDSTFTRLSVGIGRVVSELLHKVIPGKVQAEALVVANDLTAKALPKHCIGKRYQVIESGVDLSLWQPRSPVAPTSDRPVRFVFAGRFVDWKGVEFLIDAFAQALPQMNAVLELVGDGELRQALEAQVERLGVKSQVMFYGWMNREAIQNWLMDCDVFVMPSLRECGGTAILEAMAIGLPIIATNWAGPGNYVDASCGILVDPTSKAAFVDGLAEAMVQLASAPEQRQTMGAAGIYQVRQRYLDWDSKVDRLVEIFEETIATACPQPASVS
jgi:glycosyltransferase involved in cell wall biosynthesis